MSREKFSVAQTCTRELSTKRTKSLKRKTFGKFKFSFTDRWRHRGFIDGSAFTEGCTWEDDCHWGWHHWYGTGTCFWTSFCANSFVRICKASEAFSGKFAVLWKIHAVARFLFVSLKNVPVMKQRQDVLTCSHWDLVLFRDLCGVASELKWRVWSSSETWAEWVSIWTWRNRCRGYSPGNYFWNWIVPSKN